MQEPETLFEEFTLETSCQFEHLLHHCTSAIRTQTTNPENTGWQFTSTTIDEENILTLSACLRSLMNLWHFCTIIRNLGPTTKELSKTFIRVHVDYTAYFTPCIDVLDSMWVQLQTCIRTMLYLTMRSQRNLLEKCSLMLWIIKSQCCEAIKYWNEKRCFFISINWIYV